jgi:hypothetical protein
MRVPWEKIPWDKSGNSAQIASAVMAFASVIIASLTLVFALRQSSKTAELLDHARDAFVAQSFPVVKFDRYQWVNAPNASISCTNPTVGLNVYYRNFSGVPVIIEEADFNIKMGERPLFTGPAEIEDIQREAILPPGISLATGKTGSPIHEVYPRLRGRNAPPYMNFEMTITYRSLVSGKRYRYTGKVIMYEDCGLPNQRFFALAGETLAEIPTQK